MVSYIPSLITLNQYDSNKLSPPALTNEQHYKIDLQESYTVLETLKTELVNRDEATELFALPRESGLESIIGAIYQSYDGYDVYPSVEEKAANLLYLTIKNHPFVD
jgi:prophage maintenance system killer protein